MSARTNNDDSGKFLRLNSRQTSPSSTCCCACKNQGKNSRNFKIKIFLSGPTLHSQILFAVVIWWADDWGSRVGMPKKVATF